jgi:hypothetical protein
MKIFEVKYTDGRKFKVAISDNTKDLDCLISEAHKKGTVEKIENLVVVGINTLKDFEKL